jgi:hypothetical protein
MRFPYPSREPTPSEYAVLVIFVAAVFVVLGVVALVAGIRAPPQKHERQWPWNIVVYGPWGLA